MSPSNIESALKGASPLIGQACVIGDGQPYNTALIVLDSDFGPAWAAKQGIDGADLAALARDERMQAAVQKGIDDANAKLARVEQIKKFTLVEADWLPGGDELTPTMKLKRKPIASKYAGEIRSDVLEERFAAAARALARTAAARPPPWSSRHGWPSRSWSRGCCSRGCGCCSCCCTGVVDDGAGSPARLRRGRRPAPRVRRWRARSPAWCASCVPPVVVDRIQACRATVSSG